MCELDCCQHKIGEVVDEIQVEQQEFTESSRFRRLLSAGLRNIVNIAPIIQRQAEFSAACTCNGFCPTCVGAGVGSLVVTSITGRDDGGPRVIDEAIDS